MADNSQKDNQTQIDIHSPSSSEKMPEGYRVSDVQQVFKDSHPTSWQDLLTFIKNKSDGEWHITPGEAKSMAHDVQQLVNSNKPFPKGDPQKAFQEMKAQGGKNMR